MAFSPRIGLALGGGGARGFAHIGVIKTLLREKIPIDLMAGSSMGAVIGAAFALFKDITALSDLAIKLSERIPQLEELNNINQLPKAQKHSVKRVLHFIKEIYLYNVGITRTSMIDNVEILAILEEVFNQHTFTDLQIPFTAVATELRSGKDVVLQEGLLAPALLASMAIPGIFEPVKRNSELLVDGAVTSQVPVETVRSMGADFVIAVNVERNIYRKNFDRGIDILFQVDEIRGAELNRLILSKANFVIEPKIGHINWAQFSKAEECIRRGEQATSRLVPQIKKRIRRVKLKRIIHFWELF